MMQKLFLLYILFGLTNGFLNFDLIKDTIKDTINNMKNKSKEEQQPFCNNCGKFDNSWNDMISLKLKETQFEKINKCKNNTSFYICNNTS